MATRCPHCNVPLTQDEARSDNCPACGQSFLDGPRPGADDADAPRRREDEFVQEGRPARRDDLDERVGEGRPTTRLPAYDDDDDDDGRPDSRRSYGSRTLDAAWGTVQGGLNTMFFSYLGVIVAYLIYILLIVIMVVSAQGRNQGPNPVILAPICLVLLAVIAAGIAHLVGMFMCLAAPRAKGWMGAALSFLGLSILLLIGTIIVIAATAERRPGGDPAMALIPLFVGIGAFYGSILLSVVCLIMFLKRLGQYFDNGSLVTLCNTYYVIQVLCLGTMAGVVVLLISSGFFEQVGQPNAAPDFRNIGVAAISLYGVSAVGGLILAVLYPVMLRMARNTIDQA